MLSNFYYYHDSKVYKFVFVRKGVYDVDNNSVINLISRGSSGCLFHMSETQFVYFIENSIPTNLVVIFSWYDDWKDIIVSIFTIGEFI